MQTCLPATCQEVVKAHDVNSTCAPVQLQLQSVLALLHTHVCLPSTLSTLQWNQGKGSSALRLQWRAPGSQRWEELPVTVPPAPFGASPGRWTPLS